MIYVPLMVESPRKFSIQIGGVASFIPIPQQYMDLSCVFWMIWIQFLMEKHHGFFPLQIVDKIHHNTKQKLVNHGQNMVKSLLNHG